MPDMEVKGKIVKGIADYWNIMTKDIRLADLRNKEVTIVKVV